MKKNTIILCCLAFLLLATTGIIPVQAQQTSSQYALYNYRNDGNFDAWLNIDIDSITYSHFDLDSIEHDEIVVQDVWTSDSLYRIPMEYIDSIGFRAPAPVMQEGIFYLREYHAAHTLVIDSLTIYFDNSIHRDSLPSIGQAILSSTEVSPYEEGFSGKVKSLEREADRVKVICEYAGIGDFYKKLVMVGKATTEAVAEARSKSPDNFWGYYYDKGVKPIEDIGDLSFSILGGIFTIESKKPDVRLKYQVYIDEGKFLIYAGVDIIHHDLSRHLNISYNKIRNLSRDVQDLFNQMNDPGWFDKWLEKNMKDNKTMGDKKAIWSEEKNETLGEIDLLNYVWKKHKCKLIDVFFGPLRVQFEIAPLLKLKWDAELDWEKSTSAVQSMNFLLKGNSLSALMSLYSPNVAMPIAMLTGAVDYDSSAKYEEKPGTLTKLDITGKASITAGVAPKLTLSLIHKNILHASLGAELGLKASTALNLKLADIETKKDDWNFYESLKDSKVASEFYIKISPEIGVTPSKFLTAKTEWEVLSKDLGSLYLFPSFTKPSLPNYDPSSSISGWGGYSPTALSTITTNNVLIPGYVGIGLYNKNGKREYEFFSDIRYNKNSDWDNRWLQMELKNLPKGITYTARPLFKLPVLGTVSANPSTEITVGKDLSLSEQNIKIRLGETRDINIAGGWGLFEIWNNAAPIVEINNINKTANNGRKKKSQSKNTIYLGDKNSFTIEAKKIGTGILVVYDIRSGQEKPINIEVTNEPLEKLTLSSTSFSMTVGEKKTTEITSGNGNYDIENKYPKIISVELNGNTISIEAKSKGDATFTITDTKSKQSIEVTVNVKEKPSQDLALSTQEVYLNVGETKQIEVTAGSGHYSVWIYAPEVANVTVNGNIITIKGLSSGKTIVKVTDTSTNKTIPFGIEVKGPSVNEKDAVDLGLSVKWAKMNVGAVSEEDCGEHYAWGETESKSYFSWSSYDFCNGTESTISKYNNVDGKTMLDPSNDAAHVIMGGNWRTPTLTEMEELVNRCKWTVETLNGVKGARVTGPNGNSIFLPFGGQMFEDQLSHYDNSGYYYASTLSSNGEKYAPALCCFGSGNKQEFVHYARYYGLSIRGVLSK